MTRPRIRLFPTDKRIDTGPVQFGDDWPGVFIRGDETLALATALKMMQGDLDDVSFDRSLFGGLAKTLSSCRVASPSLLLENG